MNSEMSVSPQKEIDDKLFEQFCFDFYGELLSDRQKSILEYYYNEDYSLSEIGEIVGMTRQGVHDAFRRAKGIMASYEDKLGLVNRFLKNRTLLSEIRTEISMLLSNEVLKSNDALQNDLEALQDRFDRIIEGY